jgi:hypothetical protein
MENFIQKKIQKLISEQYFLNKKYNAILKKKSFNLYMLLNRKLVLNNR